MTTPNLARLTAQNGSVQPAGAPRVSIFDTLTALCGPDQLARGLWLLPALLLAGLAGSVVHCTAMCGPFVLGQVADGMARMPAAHMCQAARLRSSLLLPYHAGRLATYTTLGIAAGWLGGLRLPHVLPATLLALAAVGFLVLALRRLQPSLAAAGHKTRSTYHMPPVLGGWSRAVGRLRGVPLGLALGFLPCGMVYAALAAAAASGAIVGGLGMLAFGLGTVPALFAVALLGHVVARRWQATADRAAPWVLAANGILIAALSWQALG